MVTKQAFQVAADLNLVCDGQLLKSLARGGLKWLEHNHEHVNHLNVFPVPDGDTGTNMLLTMREAYAAIEHSAETRVDLVAAALARGALMGARGNSGTILSQLWQGFADGLKGHAEFDAKLFSEAVKRGSEAAYKSVSTPVEGTILTVARESMEAVVERVQEGEADLVAALKIMLLAARASLRNTPNLLPLLKQAGVVDSGGQGFVYILEGMLHAALNKVVAPPPREGEAEVKQPQGWQEALVPEDDEGYGYDVQFRMHGFNLDVTAVRAAMEEMGWSTVVVGDSRLVKVHVHVHDPSKPIGYAIGLGVDIDDVVVENMQMQYQQYVQSREAREGDDAASGQNVAVIAVVPGAGLRRLFQEQLGTAWVISGGQTMNPSTGDFVEAINALPQREIILLPNNKNIILAAQQAANVMNDRNIRVVPSRTLPQGISAMFALSNLGSPESAEEAAGEMLEALKMVTSAEITTATRNVDIGGVNVREGQLIGLLEGNLVVSGTDMVTVMRDLLRKAEADKRELITLYYGSDTHKAKAQALVDALAADFPRQTFEIVFGGQALYPYIISIE